MARRVEPAGRGEAFMKEPSQRRSRLANTMPCGPPDGFSTGYARVMIAWELVFEISYGLIAKSRLVMDCRK
jgi:hypothetical protein